ncbi:hypothetical protein NC651_030950 [Populus alba x Populus x berolinensis]|nr:hypothetical protein NC651_030950 [Populus alba x Populus x berolinensis]
MHVPSTSGQEMEKLDLASIDTRGTTFSRTNIIITVRHRYLINLWLWNFSSYFKLCTKPRYHLIH